LVELSHDRRGFTSAVVGLAGLGFAPIYRLVDNRAVPVPLGDLEALVGTSFPGGTYTIEPYRHWLMADAVGEAPSSTGAAGPMEIYFGAMGGLGLSLDELFALVGSSSADGPMFGEAEIEQRIPLRIGESYEVRGGITGVVRKEGRRAGVFDIVTFRLELVGADGEVAGVSTNSFVFPRRD
jgi:hypothetical protein